MRGKKAKDNYEFEGVPQFQDMADPNFLEKFDQESDELYRWFFISDEKPSHRRREFTQSSRNKNHCIKTFGNKMDRKEVRDCKFFTFKTFIAY